MNIDETGHVMLVCESFSSKELY